MKYFYIPWWPNILQYNMPALQMTNFCFDFDSLRTQNGTDRSLH